MHNLCGGSVDTDGEAILYMSDTAIGLFSLHAHNNAGNDPLRMQAHVRESGSDLLVSETSRPTQLLNHCLSASTSDTRQIGQLKSFDAAFVMRSKDSSESVSRTCAEHA